jgi:predicted nucleotidyltransferase
MDINLSFIKNEYFLRKLENCINQLFRIKKEIQGIILFGSLARDKAIYSAKKISDIDIIVIFKDNQLPKNHNERINLQIKLMDLKELGFDSLWMTESEFKNLVQIKADMILDVLNEGIVLYDPYSLINEQKGKLFKELEEKGVIKREHYWIWPLKNLGDEIEW